MNDSVFIHIQFWVLLLASLVLPVAIYFLMLRIRRISRYTVLLFGLALIPLSALDVFLLQHLGTAARATRSLLNDKVFASEFSLALYLLPLLSAGVGVNIFSDVLLNHLRRVLHDVGARAIASRARPCHPPPATAPLSAIRRGKAPARTGRLAPVRRWRHAPRRSVVPA